MNREDYLAAQAENYLHCLRLSEEKSSDYAGDGDPFRNFRLTAMTMNRPVWEVILSRISEKVIRVQNLLEKRDRGEERAVKDEPVEKTLEDLIVMPNLLKVWLEEEARDRECYGCVADDCDDCRGTEIVDKDDPCDDCREEDCMCCIEIVDFNLDDDEGTCECDPDVKPEFTHTCQCEACKTMRGMGPAGFIIFDPPVVMATYTGFPKEEVDLDDLDFDLDKLEEEREKKE